MGRNLASGRSSRRFGVARSSRLIRARQSGRFSARGCRRTFRRAQHQAWSSNRPGSASCGDDRAARSSLRTPEPLHPAAMAVLHHRWDCTPAMGEPRFTRYVDATLLSDFGNEDEFIRLILSAGYRGRIPDAAGFARRNQVLLLDSTLGIPIDVALGALPFEVAVVGRASRYEFEPGCSLLTCSAEDLIFQKLFAFRNTRLAGLVLYRDAARTAGRAEGTTGAHGCPPEATAGSRLTRRQPIC